METKLESRQDFCSATGLKVHSYSDYRYWVEDPKFPIKCSICGFIDKTRTVEEIDEKKSHV